MTAQKPRGPVAIHARLSPHRAGRGAWWRYSWLLLTALAAVTLTFFSLFRIELHPSPQISFRQHSTWQSTQTLLIAQSGFSHPMPMPISGPGPPSLADLYAALAKSPELRALVLKSGPLHGRYAAAAVQNSVGRPLPLLRISGQAGSPAQATRIAARVPETLSAYIKQQTNAGIPQTQRVRLEMVNAPLKPTLIQGHWRKGPLIALSIVMALLLLAAVIKFAEEHR